MPLIFMPILAIACMSIVLGCASIGIIETLAAAFTILGCGLSIVILLCLIFGLITDGPRGLIASVRRNSTGETVISTTLTLASLAMTVIAPLIDPETATLWIWTWIGNATVFGLWALLPAAGYILSILQNKPSREPAP